MNIGPYQVRFPAHILFGPGSRHDLGQHCQAIGQRAFIVTGSRTLQKLGLIDSVIDAIKQSGIEAIFLANISHEPEVADVDNAVEQALKHSIQPTDFIVGIGGGSAIDLAKAVAALVTNREGETVTDYLEGVGQGLTLKNKPLPVVAVPTTAGTGSEATKNAVISSYDPAFKKSLRADALVPALVVIDAELAIHAPAEVTIHSGLDAITQLIEGYISKRSQPIPRALALQGLAVAIPALPEAVANPTSIAAREKMAHAALLSGIALANSGLGMAHGVAAALGVHNRIPHGLACACMLPTALRVNRDVCGKQLAEVAFAVTGRHFESTEKAADAVVETICQLTQQLGVPQRLSELGVEKTQLPDIVQSSRGNSMNGNPVDLSDEQLLQILEDIL